MIKKFDKEYSTQYIKEVEFLKMCNIEYTFVKVVDGVTIYKYTKTPQLFNALKFFYEIVNKD